MVIRERLRERALAKFVVIRRRMLPVLVTVGIVLAAADPTPARVSLFALALSCLVGLILVERRTSHLPSTPTRARNTLIASGLAQLLVIFAGGGLGGPLLPASLLMTLFVGIALPAREAAGFVALVQIPAVWTFVAFQAFGWLPELHIAPYDGLFSPPGTGVVGPIVGGVFFSVMLAAALGAARTMRRVITELIDESIREREASLRQDREATANLVRLSAEIAHELKNPLASIKGLTALVRRGLTGVSAERMDVLRREVDRLQSILDELLTFSRPVVPLHAVETHLAALVDEACALYQPLAIERGIEVVRSGPDLVVVCDPGKIRRIVTNLLENALDASPPGGRIDLDLALVGEDVRLVVRDRGVGLDQGVRARLFEPFVTSKTRGTGLGLVVARGLARQHGGELTLDDATGATEASLVLPKRRTP